MALITELIKADTKNFKVHNPTHRCDFFSFKDEYGNAYLQIETFGSETRANPDIPSQTVQFSPKAIEQLKDILKNLTRTFFKKNGFLR